MSFLLLAKWSAAQSGIKDREQRIAHYQQHLLRCIVMGDDERRLAEYRGKAVHDGVPPEELEVPRAMEAVAGRLADRLERSSGRWPEQREVFREASERGIPREMLLARADLGVFEDAALEARRMKLLDEFVNSAKDPRALPHPSLSLEVSHSVPSRALRARLQALVRDSSQPIHIRSGAAGGLSGDIFGGSDRFLVDVAADPGVPESVRCAALSILSGRPDLTLPGDAAVLRSIAGDATTSSMLRTFAANAVQTVLEAHPREMAGATASAILDPGSPIPLRMALEGIGEIQPEQRAALEARLREIVKSEGIDAQTRFLAVGVLGRKFGRAAEVAAIAAALHPRMAPDFGRVVLTTLGKRAYPWRESALRIALERVAAEAGPLQSEALAVLATYRDSERKSEELGSGSPARVPGK